jgi:hypothetical protein
VTAEVAFPATGRYDGHAPRRPQGGGGATSHAAEMDSNPGFQGKRHFRCDMEHRDIATMPIAALMAIYALTGCLIGSIRVLQAPRFWFVSDELI